MAPADPSPKAALRADAAAARRAMGPDGRAGAAAELTRALLALPEIASARCVAAYLSFGTEPDTTAALAGLFSRGVRILVPVVLPGHDLDWVVVDRTIYDEATAARGSRATLWTPQGPRLGVDALADADAVVVPALSVAADGTRLGRGGGSYDRALSRARSTTPVIALLYDGELVPALPAEPHDRPVTLVVTPSRVVRVGRG